MNYGHKQHSYVVGHIARYLIYRHGLASVPACVGFEICRVRAANSCITLFVDSEYLIFTGHILANISVMCLMYVKERPHNES
jgi:hypothetical protein